MIDEYPMAFSIFLYASKIVMDPLNWYTNFTIYDNSFKLFAPVKYTFKGTTVIKEE